MYRFGFINYATPEQCKKEYEAKQGSSLKGNMLNIAYAKKRAEPSAQQQKQQKQAEMAQKRTVAEDSGEICGI